MDDLLKTDNDQAQPEALALATTPETIPFVRVALCAACGVRYPWTPERGWGCPRVVAPQDTTGALAERLRDAQTVALVLALRAVKTRRGHALQVETTARVTAERDALRAALEELAEAVGAMHAATVPSNVEVAWRQAERVLARTGGV